MASNEEYQQREFWDNDLKKDHSSDIKKWCDFIKERGEWASKTAGRHNDIYFKPVIGISGEIVNLFVDKKLEK